MEGLAVRDAGERAQVLLEVASARRAQGHLLPSRGLLVLSFEAGRYDVGGGKGTRLLLFQHPDAPAVLSTGSGRHWPHGRGSCIGC